MTECQRVSLPQAAAELGCANQAVRERMKRGIWDLGEVIPPDKSIGQMRHQYHIYRPKLDRLVGKVTNQNEQRPESGASYETTVKALLECIKALERTPAQIGE